MPNEKSITPEQSHDFKHYIDNNNGLSKDLINEAPIYIHYSSGSKGAGISCLRVYKNGELWRYSNTRKVIENNLPKRIKDEYAWRFEAKISAKGLETLIALLKSDFDVLESKEKNPGSRDRGMHYRCAIYNDGFKEVYLPAGPIPEGYSAIQNVDNAIYHNIIVEDEEE